MEWIVNSLIKQMIEQNMLEQNLQEWYRYVMVQIMQTLLGMCSILAIGACFQVVIPTVLFLVYFLLLRKHTGGLHMSSARGCYFVSTGLYVMIVLLFQAVEPDANRLLMCAMIGAGVIFLIGTVNHPNLHLNHDELVSKKRLTRCTVGLELLLLIFLWYIGIESVYLNYLSAAIILCAVTMIISKIIKQEVTEDEKSGIKEQIAEGIECRSKISCQS